ncbi:unnamed protein product [Rhizoctonia solani]|uniref:Uncharacterized protein n=1 Tax=Rhizoctonia solani TaxID=456999 RepID=A0A8H3C3F5_9AGAM|nr:unnamed protein product [Rhizoctonia solani]
MLRLSSLLLFAATLTPTLALDPGVYTICESDTVFVPRCLTSTGFGGEVKMLPLDPSDEGAQLWFVRSMPGVDTFSYENIKTRCSAAKRAGTRFLVCSEEPTPFIVDRSHEVNYYVDTMDFNPRVRRMTHPPRSVSLLFTPQIPSPNSLFTFNRAVSN